MMVLVARRAPGDVYSQMKSFSRVGSASLQLHSHNPSLQTRQTLFALPLFPRQRLSSEAQTAVASWCIASCCSVTNCSFTTLSLVKTVLVVVDRSLADMMPRSPKATYKGTLSLKQTSDPLQDPNVHLEQAHL